MAKTPDGVSLKSDLTDDVAVVTGATRGIGAEIAAGLVELGLGVPYEMTWSCYRDEEPACGTCDACAFRLEAFRNAGSRDPIAYAERPEFS